MKDIKPALLGFFILLKPPFFSEISLAHKSSLDDLCGLSAALCLVLIIVIIIVIVLIIVFLIKEIFSSSKQRTTVVQTPQQQPPPHQQARRRRPMPPPSSRKLSKNCPDCEERMRYIEEHSRWFCEKCREYKVEGKEIRVF